jgi:hypothetical protein
MREIGSAGGIAKLICLRVAISFAGRNANVQNFIREAILRSPPLGLSQGVYCNQPQVLRGRRIVCPWDDMWSLLTIGARFV